MKRSYESAATANVTGGIYADDEARYWHSSAVGGVVAQRERRTELG